MKQGRSRQRGARTSPPTGTKSLPAAFSGLQTPDAQAADLQNLQTPDAQAPDPQTPDYRTPDPQHLETPDAKAPDPQTPDFRTPDSQHLETPDAKAPDAQTPARQASNVWASDPSTSEAESSSIETPDDAFSRLLEHPSAANPLENGVDETRSTGQVYHLKSGAAPHLPIRAGILSAGISSAVLSFRGRTRGSIPVRLRALTATVLSGGRTTDGETTDGRTTGGETTGSETTDGRKTDGQTTGSDALGSGFSGTARRIAVTTAVTGGIAAAYLLTRTEDGWPIPAHTAADILDPSGSLLGVSVWVWAAWIPFFAGTLAYAVFQWLPSQQANSRHSWSGWVVTAAVVLGFLWLWAAQHGNAAAAFWLAASQVATGLTAVIRGNTWPPETRTERLTTDFPCAIFLGIASLALLVSLGSWLAERRADAGGWGAEAWTLIALVSLVVGVTTVCMTGRGQLAVALTVVWGLAGLGLARLLEEPVAVWPAVAAFGAAFLILVSAGSRRHQVDQAQRRTHRQWLIAEASALAAGEAPEAARS